MEISTVPMMKVAMMMVALKNVVFMLDVDDDFGYGAQISFVLDLIL
jgi:hypothetical protein